MHRFLSRIAPRKLHKLGWTLAAVLVTGIAAHAGDILPPAPAPDYRPPPAVPPYIWTGFYLGGNGGYSWGHQDTSLSVADATYPNCHFCASATDSFTVDMANIQNAGSPGLNLKGFTGGGQFGFNWQVSHWVFGVEVDYESFRLNATNNTSTVLPQLTAYPACAASCVASLSTSVSTQWLFTARPRIGIAWDQTLLYATGGVAITKVSFAQSDSDNVVVGEGNGLESASAAKTAVGWTVGAGVEQALTRSFSVRAEYLYTQFAGLNASGVLHDSVPTDSSNFANTTGRLTTSTVRGRLDFNF